MDDSKTERVGSSENNINQKMSTKIIILPARWVKDATFTILEDTGLLSRSGNRSLVKTNALI
jgi:hypothetical protein